MKELIKKAESIWGWLTPDEMKKLYQLGLESNGDIIEIGTHKGRSTFLIASGIKESGRNNKLFTLDIHDHNIKPMIKDNRLDQIVVTTIGHSNHYISKIMESGNIRSAFIDGDHGYQQCLADYQNIVNGVKRGERIKLAFHDYKMFPGVTKTIDEHVRKHPGFSYITLQHTLFICKIIH